MDKKPVFAVYDVKGKFFWGPVTCVRDVDALRSFEDAVNHPGSIIHSSPSDYSLAKLATFDEETGKFENLIQPDFVCSALQCLKVDVPAGSNAVNLASGN